MDPDPDTTFHFDGSGSLDHKNLQQQKITEKHHAFVKKNSFLVSDEQTCEDIK